MLALMETLVFLTLEMTGFHTSGSEKWLTFHWQSWSVGIHLQQKDLPHQSNLVTTPHQFLLFLFSNITRVDVGSAFLLLLTS